MPTLGRAGETFNWEGNAEDLHCMPPACGRCPASLSSSTTDQRVTATGVFARWVVVHPEGVLVVLEDRMIKRFTELLCAVHVVAIDAPVKVKLAEMGF